MTFIESVECQADAGEEVHGRSEPVGHTGSVLLRYNPALEVAHDGEVHPQAHLVEDKADEADLREDRARINAEGVVLRGIEDVRDHLADNGEGDERASGGQH